MPPRPPDIFFIGVPRAASSSLYEALGQHPGVFAPDQKEICHTCIDLDPGNRPADTLWLTDRDEYLGKFTDARPDQRILEGCVYNVYSHAAPAAIAEINGDARFLIQLRDPLEQMYSNHALKWIMRDTSSKDFRQAVSYQDGLRDRPIGAEPPINFAQYDMRDKASVSFGLARFVERFGRDRIHVTLYEDYAADPLAVIRSIYEAMGVEPGFTPNVKVIVPNRVAKSDGINKAMASPTVVSAAKRLTPLRLHSAARRVARAGFRINRRVESRPPMPADLERQLRIDFTPEVERLSQLTGMDLVSRWWS